MHGDIMHVDRGRHTKPIFVMSILGLEARAFTGHHQYFSLFTMSGTGQHEMGIITVGHCPHVSTSMSLHVIRSPRPSLSIFASSNCKQSKTAGRNSLETAEQV